MSRYGKKTRIISFFLTIIGLLMVILPVPFRGSSIFEGLISLGIVFIFSGIIIYLVIYKQFEKLEKIAEEVEKGKI